jgi:ribosomal-protein-alanine N-acetyltransferase
MTVRPFAPGDVDACAALLLEIPLWRQYRLTPERARAVFGRVARGEAHAYVADDAGCLLGCVVYSLRGTFDHSGYIRLLAVAEGAQGKGVGSRLLGAAEEAIFRTGPNVFLLVTATNAHARRFYERRGYRPVGDIPDYLCRGITEVLYRKTLGPIYPDDPGGGET